MTFSAKSVGRLIACLTAVPLILLSGTSNASAMAPPDLPGPVSTVQSDWTPYIDAGQFQDGADTQVWDFAYTPGVFYACGKFNGGHTRPDDTPFHRDSILGFYSTGSNRGQLTSFAPVVRNGANMGTINRCMLSYGGKAILIAGSFTSVNGVEANNIAMLNLATGAVRTGFNATVDGAVTDLDKTHGYYLLSGSFTHVDGRAQSSIATVKRDGSFSSYFHSTFTGKLAHAGRARAYRVAVSSNDGEMGAIVNSNEIDGIRHQLLVRFVLGDTSARLMNWDTPLNYVSGCSGRLIVNDLEYSPDSSFFVTGGTGGPHYNGLCDQIIKWPTSARGTQAMPLWRNRTRADTTKRVAVTTNVIYAQGHMKGAEKVPGGAQDWADRNGIFALRTSDGHMRAWRSDQSRCVGGQGLTVVPAGTGNPAGLLSGKDCGNGLIYRQYVG